MNNLKEELINDLKESDNFLIFLEINGIKKIYGHDPKPLAMNQEYPKQFENCNIMVDWGTNEDENLEVYWKRNIKTGEITILEVRNDSIVNPSPSFDDGGVIKKGG